MAGCVAVNSRRLINASLGVLALFVLLLSGKAGWHAWGEYRVAREVAQANALADALIEAAGLHAVERGLTAAALGTVQRTRTARDADATRITSIRRQADARWGQAMAMADKLDGGAGAEFSEKLLAARAAYAELAVTRSRVDACLAARPCTLDGTAWVYTVVRFLDRAALLREAAFLPLDTPRHVAQINLALKRWVWMASEYAGRERGLLAWYVASRRPLPPERRDELLGLRGVVDRAVRDILALKELRHTDPRILQAIADMERGFLNDYEISRNEVYSAADSGHYPFDEVRWIREASRGIDSLLAVAAAVSRVADDQANRSMRESQADLYGHVLLGLLAVVLALLGVVWVRRTANALFQQKELAEVTLHSIGDAVITTDARAQVEFLNPVAEVMTGWNNREAKGQPLAEIFRIVNGHSRLPEPSPIETCLRENRVVGLASNTVLLARDGREYAIEDSAAPIRDREGRVLGGVLVFYDVLQSRYGFHLLSYHTTHDPVTGLINRAEFERRLCEFRVRAREHSERHALCYLDLDQFKVVNDTCGHGAGDQLLKRVAKQLSGPIRESDILARLGGDEFGLLLSSCPLERALSVAEQLRDGLSELRFEWDGKCFDLHASIGLVAIDADSPTPVDLLAQADAACHVAKQKGRNRVQVYAAGDLDMARRHGEMRWAARLNRAIEEDRFELYCQAIVTLRDSPGHGEILLRLRDEDGRLVSPGEFIPAAERYDLMPAIDRWVIRHALNGLASARPSAPHVFGINLSGTTLCEPDFAPFLRGQCAKHGIDPTCLCLEITETAAVANLEQAAEVIRTLRAQGFRFALDDFGSGLSSFMYLKSLPVDYLKIDGSFVRAMTTNPVARATVQAIHTVGSTIGIATIAEYVENETLLELLREMGVDYAQGYAVGQPLPLAEYFRTLNTPAQV